MQTRARWVVEIVLLMVLVAAAVAVQNLMPVPFGVTALALVLCIFAAHVALDAYQETR